MDKIKQENRQFWADNLRVFATIAIILLHVSAKPVTLYGNISSFFWWIGNFYDSIVRFGVPIFVMLTGALILPKEYEIGDFLKKRLIRVVYPLLFWSIIYIFYSLGQKYIDGNNITLYEMAKFVYVSFRDGSYYHLWFIYMLIGIYLFVPIIGKWVRICSEKEILYFLLIWVFTLFLNQPVISKLKLNIELTYFSGYLGYLILGYYLSIKTFKNKRKINPISILLIVSGIMITVLGTYFVSNLKNEFNGIFYSYLSPNILMVSVGLFLFFKNHNYTNIRRSKIIGFISRYSYGIYLVHVLILLFLDKIGIDWQFTNPVFAIPITTIFCLFISGIIIFLVNKMPYGKYISG